MRIDPARCAALALLLPMALLAGCAKRPATTAASAPAPTAAQPVTSAPARQTDAAKPAPAPSAPGNAVAPATARPAPSEFVAVAEVRDIHFDFDKDDVRPHDAEILGANAQWLKAHPDYLVLVEGHCDERGTNEYNMALGDRRAKSTMSFLVGQGVEARRMSVISYGEERPSCTQKDETCWSRNRRAHFLVKPR
jgi:peptidoglycan-associated lipoprotein